MFIFTDSITNRKKANARSDDSYLKLFHLILLMMRIMLWLNIQWNNALNQSNGVVVCSVWWKTYIGATNNCWNWSTNSTMAGKLILVVGVTHFDGLPNPLKGGFPGDERRISLEGHCLAILNKTHSHTLPICVNNSQNRQLVYSQVYIYTT